MAAKQPPVYRPKTATIRRVCAEIRETWDEFRFQRSGRLDWRRVEYEFPTVGDPQLRQMLEEFDGNAEDEAGYGP